MAKKKKGTKRRPRGSPRVRHTATTATSEKTRGRPWLMVVLSAGVLLSAIYSVSLFSPTLITHDNSILRLPVLSHVRNVPHIISRDFPLFTSGQYRPLSYVLVAVARTFVAADRVLFWHIWLLAFHFANTLLVFAIARHFSSRLGVALTAAAVFGLHPLCTVIVNDINQFYMLLGLTLSLGSLRAYLSFSRSGNKTLYSVAVGLFVLAVLTARPVLWLGLILLAYELLYERSRLRRALLRLVPFALIPLFLLPLRTWCTPHPLHYKYVGVYKGLFWHGLFSVTGATRHYAGGLVLTRGIPLVLHDIVEKIYRWGDAQFLIWAAFNLVLIVGAVLVLARKHWPALGVLLMYIAMIPYASVAYNRVDDYVSWSYLYFPAAGFALFAAGVWELGLRARSRHLRHGVIVAFLAGVLFFAGRSVQLNWHTRTPLTYWKYVSEMDKRSQTALYETGKAYLGERRLPEALHYFFAPVLKDLKRPCLAMARSYLAMAQGYYQKKEYLLARQYLLASAIHLRAGSAETKIGLILEDHCETAGELLLEAGALDHAEENFGKVLMVNPFNTAAMTRLAQVWFLKGFVGEAQRMLERARSLAPDDKNITLTKETFAQKQRQWRDNPQPFAIDPPDPHWLRYVLTQMRSPSLRREIVALSDIADPNDAVIQLEAIVCLLIDEEYEAAAKEIVPATGETRPDMVLHGLSGNAYACAVVSQALALAGDVERAVQVGLRAATLDNKSTLAWESLALVFSLQDKPDATSQEIMEDIAQHPGSASILYCDLGLEKRRAGKNEEAAALFAKAVTAQPNNVEALQALGETLLALGEFEQSSTVLQKALALDPGDAKTHGNLGYALLSQRKNAEGAASLRTAIELDPKNAVYHSDLAVCLARLNREAEAIQEFRRATELDPRSADVHQKLANTLVSVGNLSEAVAEYRQVIKIMPAQHYVHFNLGTVLYRLGKIDEAINEFREEILHNPTFGDAYARLASLYLVKGDDNLAQDVLKRAQGLGIIIDPVTFESLPTPRPDEKR